MKTMTARVIASGFATGVMKSLKASSVLPGLSFTGSGRSGAASSSRSLSASAALPMALPSFGWRSARIFSTMFCRYSGSLAASDTACVAAKAPTAKMIAKPTKTTISVASGRPSFQRSRRRTAGASTNDSRIAIASGTSTSFAK